MNGEREGRGRAVQERGAGYEWRVRGAGVEWCRKLRGWGVML